MQLLQIHEPGQTPLPHEGGVAVGIDLGTTYSVVAMASEGAATVLRDSCGGALVPSVVWYGGGEARVGKEARAHYQQGDALAVASVKRLMGRGREDALAQNLPYGLAEGEGMVRLELGERRLSPVEISADILRYLKKLAETSLGQEVTQAVITVPAYFDEAARQATKDAATLAGLDVLRLVSEPTAAALAYGLDSGAEGIYAVYDLGGGTFDISVLRMEKGVFQVLATGGHVALGGDDVDRAIAHHWGVERPGGEMLSLARQAKEQLSAEERVALRGQDGLTRILTREELAALARPFVEETIAICAQVLEDAGLAKEEIKGVVLVGGSTRLEAVREAAERFFGRAPLAGINPDEVVAVGAAIQAEGLTRGSDNLLLDVVPLSLGIGTMGDLVEKIIHRNTPIPVAAAQEFTTYQDGQGGMVIHVVQGEREMVGQNRSLARFELSGIPPLPAGIARVKVTFAVDADGLLTVSAREEHTGAEQVVSVKPSYGLEEGEIERMLLESMQYAKEDIIERLLRESRVEAQRGIEEIRSAIAADGDLLQADEKEEINALIKSVERAVEGGDRDTIDAAGQALHKAAQPFAERRMDRAIRSALKGAHIDNVAQA